LEWEAPDYNGGSPIRGYYIEKSSGYSSRWIKANRDPLDATSKKFNDLVEGTEYEYRVLAENEAGVSKPSETTGVFVAKDPYTKPSKPGNIEVKMEKDSALLKWAKPETDGGADIENYIVEMKEQSSLSWKTVNRDEKVKDEEYKVNGLREGVAYEFRVSAQNKAGVGSPCATAEALKYGQYNIHCYSATIDTNSIFYIPSVETIIFTKELQDMTITEVDIQVTLECELSKEGLRVDWYKNGKLIRRTDNCDMVSKGTVHKLVIEKVSSEDIGEYTAEYQKLTTACKLNVEGASYYIIIVPWSTPFPTVPPSFGKHSYKDKMFLKTGQSAALELPFQASPQPSVTWSFKGRGAMDARRFKEDTIFNMTSLTMSKVVPKDAGEYSVTLENPHGKCNFCVKLIIVGKSPFPKF
jgi:titin